MGCVPVQVPLLTVTTLPSFAVPDGSGCLVFTGALALRAATPLGVPSA